MPDNSANNKRIAKNTLFLYLRMIMVMGIGLYTVRAILDLLGVVDYGIYNVVGGVVGMFQFLNGTLTSSSQRYFSIELAKRSMKTLNQWFCLNITMILFFIILFVLLAETLGLWFLNTKMTIPSERLFAANIVFQLSVVTFCVNLLSIPYNALIIAHEKMNAFAYISIIEALLKLFIVFILSCISWDKLILYAILMFVSSSLVTVSYIIFNMKNFTESRYHFYWNRVEMIELLSFSGWHFYGTFSVVIRSQGINILINIFFNPAINAARAIAFQVYHAISQLSSNFFIAVKPQIYKLYACENYSELYRLVMRSTVICSFLVSIVVFPVLTNTSYILGLWLKKIPEYAIVFTQLVLINGLVDSVNGPTTASVLATGKIRNYEIIIASLTILNLPISYIALINGAEPTTTIIISIIISFIITFTRAYILCKRLNLNFIKYIVVFIRLIITSVIIYLFVFFTIYNSAKDLCSFIIQSVFSILICVFFYVIIAFDKGDVMSALKYGLKKYSNLKFTYKH